MLYDVVVIFYLSICWDVQECLVVSRASDAVAELGACVDCDSRCGAFA